MRRLPFLLLLAFTNACAEDTAGPELSATDLDPAFAAVHLDRYNAHEPWAMTLWYDCSEPHELVSVSGTLHTISMMHLDASGANHWSFHSHPIQFRGVGLTSGREFRVVGAENTTRTIQVDGHRRFHQTALLRLMTKREPAWTLKVLIDRERTPPADWVYRLDRFEIECR